MSPLASPAGSLGFTPVPWRRPFAPLEQLLDLLQVCRHRRSLQRAHLKKLIKMATIAASLARGTPEDATSLARANLKQLNKQIVDFLVETESNDYTKAHLDECLALLEATLDASVQRRIGIPKSPSTPQPD